MRALKYMVALSVNGFAFLAGVAAPENKHHPFPLTINYVDNAIGKRLPAFALMSPGLALDHRQDTVKQQHSLFSPGLKTAVVRRSEPHIRFQLFEHINQRRRRRHPWPHAETQAMGLTWSVVGLFRKEQILFTLPLSRKLIECQYNSY